MEKISRVGTHHQTTGQDDTEVQIGESSNEGYMLEGEMNNSIQQQLLYPEKITV